MKFANGHVYDGFWKNDHFSGAGKLTTDTEMIDCEFLNGMKHGSGIH